VRPHTSTSPAESRAQAHELRTRVDVARLLDLVAARPGVERPRRTPPPELLDVSARAVAAAEHAADLVRLRAMGWLPALVWSAFIAGDWVSARHLWHVSFWPYVALRATGAFAIGALTIAARGTPTIPELRGWLVGTSMVLAATLGAQCGWAGGGVLDDYFFGVILLPLISLTTPRPLRSALAWNLAAVATFFVSTLVTCAYTPRNAPQLWWTRAWTSFGLSMTLLVAAAVIAAKVSDTTWSLRRQLFASRNLGKYELRKRLGRGGMGEIWSAWHPGLRRLVAVKIVRSEEANDIAMARFEREVSAASSLTHPNTIRVFDYGVTDDGLRWFAMELLHGEDMDRLVSREGPLPAARAVHLVAQAARALAEAHRRGIVHRDVKPENLYVTCAGDETDFVKVLDFGISKRMTGDDPVLTQVGQVTGTPAFMAPEAALGRPTDARVDVYGLGAVLYFCLAGHPPFEERSATATMIAQVQQPPMRVSIRNPGVPALLDDLIMCALEKDPLMRPSDARAFLEALESCGIERWSAEVATSLPGPDVQPIAPTDSVTLRVGRVMPAMAERITRSEKQVGA
jgi:serine/threonine-protein kinase